MRHRIALAVAVALLSTGASAGLTAAKVYECSEQSAPVDFATGEVGEYASHGRATIVDYGTVFTVVKEDFDLAMMSGVISKKQNEFGVRQSTTKEGFMMAKGTGKSAGVYSFLGKESAIVWSCF
jgi:hypothetical protein